MPSLNDLNRIQLSKHFKLSEFECKGKTCCGYSVKLTPGLLTTLELIWSYVNATLGPVTHPHPISLVSGYRCPEHNRRVGGVANSYHVQGQAADLTSPGLKKTRLAALVRELAESGLFPFRVGYYKRTYMGYEHHVLHVDTGEGPTVFGDDWGDK